jgi:hypothetical protein
VGINWYAVDNHLRSITLVAGFVMVISLIAAILGFSILAVAIVADILFILSSTVFVFGFLNLGIAWAQSRACR